jgi:hypothetical protein
MSIETLLDISSLSLEEVTGRLKAQEERMARVDSNHDLASCCMLMRQVGEIVSPARVHPDPEARGVSGGAC